MATKKQEDNVNTDTAKELDKDQKARIKASDKANKETLRVTDAVEKHVDGEVGTVSHIEHASGFRQDTGDTYEQMQEQPPLQARDIPQRLIVSDNDTVTPGEKDGTPKEGMTREEAQREVYIDTPEYHAKKGKK